MGMIDNIKNFFSRKSDSNEPSTNPFYEDDSTKKIILAQKIMNKVDQIKKIHSFDSSVLNFRYMSARDLANKSMKELEEMDDYFSNRLNSLANRPRTSNDESQAALWTGVPMKGQTKEQLSRAQERND